MKKHSNDMIVLEKELAWFEQVLHARIEQYFQQNENSDDPLSIDPPLLEGESTYTQLINQCELNPPERLVLMLALVPDLKPQALDLLFARNKLIDRPFTEFGGIVGKTHYGFIPTIETAYFLLTGSDLNHRQFYSPFFEKDHKFRQAEILDLNHNEKREPFAGTPLRLSQDTLDLLLRGTIRNPTTSVDFPAKCLTTQMEWNDLVLPSITMEQLNELMAWLDYGKTLLNDWQLSKNIKPGYRCLFYGLPGTGKTLTATLLGKQTKRDVFRVDLSRLVSKYIGETEKNLEKIFSQAEQKNWILFFDEADSLFSSRTQVSSSNDRYANQETAYLLQRIEDCPNVVILATNLKENIDEAFTRRFQSIVYFPIPEKKERLKLWSHGFSPVSTFEKEVDLERLAVDYEIAGGAIINVIRYCSLMAIQKESKEIAWSDIVAGVQREYQKDGRIVGRKLMI